MKVTCLFLSLAALGVQGFSVVLRPTGLRAAAPLVAPNSLATVPRQHVLRSVSPQMGLFGLGTPELAVIAAVGLLLLGPDQVKKMAKEVGKVSAELKQVPEEFNKGMADGVAELEQQQKTVTTAEASPPPPSPPVA